MQQYPILTLRVHSFIAIVVIPSFRLASDNLKVKLKSQFPTLPQIFSHSHGDSDGTRGRPFPKQILLRDQEGLQAAQQRVTNGRWRLMDGFTMDMFDLRLPEGRSPTPTKPRARSHRTWIASLSLYHDGPQI